MTEIMENFTAKLSKGLSALERRHKRFMNISLESDGMADVPYRYISAIKRHPDANQDFLADVFGVDKSHIARKLRMIEMAGYLKREHLPKNRRQYKLSLTEEGEKIYALIQKHSDEWEQLITAGIDEADLEVTARTISKILEKLGR